MIRSSLLAVALATVHLSARATEPVDFGPGVSDYQRFMAYPHLQRGYDALARGDARAAIAALERARSYAPRSVATALPLADAYRRAGRFDMAERVLAGQRRLTPADPRLARPSTPPRRPAACGGTSGPDCPAPRALAGAPLPARVPPVAGASVSKPSLAPRAPASHRVAAPPATDGRALGAAIEAALSAADTGRARRLLDTAASDAFPEARLALALSEGRSGDARAIAQRLLRTEPRDPGLLDRISYRLIVAGDTSTAARLLLDGWPQSTASSPMLTTRLATLLRENGALATSSDHDRLRGAAATPSVLVARAEVLAAIGDCAAIAESLAGAVAGTPGDAWAHAAHCEGDSTPAGREALRTAVERGAGPAVTSRLAYAAAAAGDAPVALAAWRALPIATLAPDELIAAATAAVSAHEPQAAIPWLEELELRGAPPTDAYWWLRAQAAPPGSALERAWIERALALREDPRYLARIAHFRSADGDRSGSVAALERARALAPGDASIAAALGYAYLAAGRPADAEPLLATYQAANPGEAPVAEDLAYINRTLVQPARARAMARTAIDLRDDDPSTDPDRLFRLRRLHEQLGRRGTLSADAIFGDAISTTNPAIPGGAYRSYAQVEGAYWLGHRIGRPDGDALSAYARVFAGAQDGGRAPDDLPTLGVGLRWKPLETQVLYLALERQFALDDRGVRDDETLVRISAAPLADPRIDRDWHAAGTGWWSHTVYLDAAHYVERGDSAATADYQVGRHIKVSDGATLEPYGRAQWNGRWQDGGFDTDARLGLGVRWNRWYGGGRHDAWPHRFVIGAEVQHAVTTYLPDRQAVFVHIGSYW